LNTEEEAEEEGADVEILGTKDEVPLTSMEDVTSP